MKADPLTDTCMTSAYNCPRTAHCWLYNKPAEVGQGYNDYPGGDDCPDYVEVTS